MSPEATPGAAAIRIAAPPPQPEALRASLPPRFLARLRVAPRTVGRVAASGALIALAACQHPPAPIEPLPPPAALANAAASARDSGPITGAAGSAPMPLIVERPGVRAAVTVPKTALRGGDVALNFADADIREIARTILGQILHVNYAIDPNVHGSATIETAKPIRRDQLLPTLVALLNQNGATLEQRDGIYRVVPVAAAAATANVVGAQNAGTGSEIVSLNYAAARDLARVLTPFAGEATKIVPDPTRNALLVSGDAASRGAVVQLIRSFDIDTLAGQSYALLPVSSDDPGKMATELQKALQSDGGDAAQAPLVRILPMERVNAVLVVAPRPRLIEDARRLFALIEAARAVSARSWHVYYVQSGQAAELANLLQNAFTPNRVTTPAPSESGTARGGATAPGLDETTIGSGAASSAPVGGAGGGFGGQGFGGQGGTSSGGIGASGVPGLSTPGVLSAGNSPGYAGSNPAEAASEPLSAPTNTEAGGSGNGGGQPNELRILPDPRTNSLLIYATAQEESIIESMLHKIDILPLQVRIDATIAEVTLNDQLAYGTQFFFKSGGINGELSFNAPATPNTVPPLSGTFPGFVLAKTTSSVQFALSALQAVTKIRVLSSPQVLVLDNQQARLQVGDLVPYLTQSAVSIQQTGAPVVNSISYQQTGVILEVTPRVNTGGLVTLDVEQQVSDVATTTSSTIDSPTFSQREIHSRVVVQDGQTIGLAGLIRDSSTEGNSGVPYLKDIPLLGALFSQQTNTRNRTELLVLITPHVIEDQRSAWALTQDMRAKLGSAAGVPYRLQTLRASGSSNPNGEAFPP